MPSTDAITLLRGHDPARQLAPLSAQERELVRDRITVLPRPRDVLQSRPSRHVGRVLILAAVATAVVIVGAGVAWAAGSWSPVALFESNPQAANGSLWDQRVIPSSVVASATLEIPDVGAVTYWVGVTEQHGWCGALQLPSGDWLGMGKDPLDAGGAVPGCGPTRVQVNAAGTPVYVINGFDYQEGDIDARAKGGSFWRVRYGTVAAPGAVRVADLISGRSAPVDADLFALATSDPNPTGKTPVHLVAFDAKGNIVADDTERP